MINQGDFREVEPLYWVLHHKGYRITVRQMDGSMEIIIREESTVNPDPKDWRQVLETVNSFYQKKRIAEDKELGV